MQLKIKLSQFTPGRTSRRSRRRRTFITTGRTRNKRRPKEILQIFNAILVMKRETFEEVVPLVKRENMLMFLKTMNTQTKVSKERRMIHMKSMC